jgi:hypothetical protein
MIVLPAFSMESPDAVVTLSGSDCGSAGSFSAVTTSVGRRNVAAGGWPDDVVDWACATVAASSTEKGTMRQVYISVRELQRAPG